MSIIVSVIVPVYNGEKYLQRCIESILKQTFQDFELLLIDDGSTDNSKKILEYYQDLDDRIHLYSKKNGGVSSARNLGLQQAKGIFITFIDADDYVSSQYLEILFNAMIKNNTDLVISNAIDVKDGKAQSIDRKTIGCKLLSQKEAMIEMFKSSLFSHVCWGNLYKNSIACKCSFDEELRVAEDGKFLYDYLSKIDKVVLIEERIYYYNYHLNSTMNGGFSDKFFDELKMYFEAHHRFEHDREIREAIVEKIFRYIKHMLNCQGISSEQWDLLLESYKYSLKLKCKKKLRKTVKYYYYRIKKYDNGK